MNRVFELQIPCVATKMVLLVLADNANEQGACWPSITTISRKSGLSERTVQRHLRELECGTLIERDARYGRSSVYQLVLWNPRQPDTPVSLTPPSPCHPTPVTVSPSGVSPCHPEPSVEPSLNLNTPLPPKGGARGGESQATKSKPVDDPLDIPKELHSPAFTTAWQRWMTFRRGLGKKPKDWRTLFAAQLEWLKDFGASNATAMLNQSMRNGWQGLFEVKQVNGHSGSSPRSSIRERDMARDFERWRNEPEPNFDA
jgi:hypothetical protein